MAMIGPNHGVNVSRMLGGAKDAKSIKKKAGDVAEQSGAVVQDALDVSIQKSMASDLKKLRTELSGTEGLKDVGMNSALMMAGALISGPNGVVPHTMAKNLKSIVADPKSRKDLAQQTVSAAKSGDGLENAQLSNMGIQVTSALTQGGVKPNNVPTALFMSGAIQHHQSS